MKNFTLLTLLASSVVLLSGCVTQQQADAKMGKGCEAALASLMGNKQIISVKATNYSDEQTEGSLYRRVTIDLVEKDGWAELDKQYSCLFAQQWGMFKSSHIGLLEQTVMDDKIVGKKDGQVVGNMDEFLNLVSKVDTAMGQ